jgi:plasmid stability protein
VSEQLLIRNLPAGTKARLKERARRNHRSVEAEARAALQDSLAREPVSMADLLADDRTEAGFDWEPPRRPMTVRPVDF